MIKKIVSGGQTGVDRAALDTAVNLEIPHGGWCPKGRLSEEPFPIPEKYLLTETASSNFEERTKLNIQDSDGTLILVPKLPVGVKDGTILTIQEVQDKRKPHLIIDLSTNQSTDEIINWVKENNIEVLNIAGPRESQSPGIYQLSCKFLEKVLTTLLIALDDNSDLKKNNSSYRIKL